jgi:hypothetical protein
MPFYTVSIWNLERQVEDIELARCVVEGAAPGEEDNGDAWFQIDILEADKLSVHRMSQKFKHTLSAWCGLGLIHSRGSLLP